MSQEQAYTDLLTAFEAAKAQWVEFPLTVDYPNRQTLDLAKQELPYIDLGVEFLHGEQLDLGGIKTVKVSGLMLMAIGTKVNGGTQAANRIAQHFADRLQLKRLGIVETQAATGGRKPTRMGWVYTPLILPFWFTRFTT